MECVRRKPRNGERGGDRRRAGKAERLWRRLNEDLLEGTTFETAEELKEELGLYLLYYNTERPHQGLGGRTPLQALQGLSTN